MHLIMSENKKNPIINYFQESYEELRKVTWPTRNQAIRLTFIVIGFCIVFSIFVGILDFAFNAGYRQLVDFSEKVAPPSAVLSGEAAPITIDPSSVTVVPAATPAAPAASPAAVKITPAAPTITPAAATTPAAASTTSTAKPATTSTKPK